MAGYLVSSISLLMGKHRIVAIQRVEYSSQSINQDDGTLGYIVRTTDYFNFIYIFITKRIHIY